MVIAQTSIAACPGNDLTKLGDRLLELIRQFQPNHPANQPTAYPKKQLQRYGSSFPGFRWAIASIRLNIIKTIVVCPQNVRMNSDRRLTARSLAKKHQSAALEGNSCSRSWKF